MRPWIFCAASQGSRLIFRSPTLEPTSMPLGRAESRRRHPSVRRPRLGTAGGCRRRKLNVAKRHLEEREAEMATRRLPRACHLFVVRDGGMSSSDSRRRTDAFCARPNGDRRRGGAEHTAPDIAQLRRGECSWSRGNGHTRVGSRRVLSRRTHAHAPTAPAWAVPGGA